MAERRAPPEDEFDRMFREGYALPGFFVFWVAIVRSWRWGRRKLGLRTRAEIEALKDSRLQRVGRAEPVIFNAPPDND